MASLEDEIKDLKEKNTELAQKVQYWKMTAAQRDDEKLALMKEINELRLKLSRLRNNGGFQARKLDAALQAASEKAISHLVKASAEIAKSMEIAKAYMRDRQELDAQSPRWSSIGGTPTTERSDRVHRVPPMMMGGQSIQPVVALSRTMLNTSNPRTTPRSPNQNHSLTERAVPMHMLQDVYIPLTRIDISELPNNNMETDAEPNIADNSVEDLRLEDVADGTDESDANMSEDDHDYEARQLDVVSEEENEVPEVEPVRLRLSVEPLLEQRDRPSRSKLSGTQRNSPRNSQRDSLRDNPLEGPSWLLDDTPPDSVGSAPKSRVNLEPDSTTELDDSARKTPKTVSQKTEIKIETGEEAARAFSPTVRRRRRTSSPPALASPRAPYSPRPASCRRNSISGRVLKVLVAKMRLDGSEGECSPPKRARSPLVFDAPSPNGATDSRVIVSETRSLPRDQETRPESVARVTRHRETQDGQQGAPGNSQDGRETKQRRRLSKEHEQARTSSEHDLRRANIQDIRESQHRGRASSQERRGCASQASRDSDSGSGGAGDSISEGRTRRTRKAVTYKEKPLNRKMRR